TALQIVAERDVDTGDAQRMTERDQLRSALGGEDARGARDAEHVALRGVTLADYAERRGLHPKNRPGDRFANRLAFVRDVHHAGVAFRRQMRKAAIRRSPPSGRQAMAPGPAWRM